MVYEARAALRADGGLGAGGAAQHVCKWNGWRRVAEGLKAHAAEWGRVCSVSSATMRRPPRHGVDSLH